MNPAHNKKILLITGGTGYIGSHAVVAFEEAGYKTVIVDNLSNSSKDTLTGIEKILGYQPDFFECDIRDRIGLEKIFQKYAFDGVMHFAGLKAFGESTTYPYMYFENNLYGSMILLDVMDRFGVQNIVFSSSASVYDASNEPPFTEEMKLGTTNPYATSKLNIEYLLKDYAKQKGFHVAVLRYFNLIGSHPSGYIGDFPRSNHGSLASNIFDVVFDKKGKLFIYGDTFPTPDGTAIRDYVDVCDLIDGHIEAYRWAEKQSSGVWDVWNLGTGSGYSVLEIHGAIEAVTGKSIPTQVLEKRNIDLAIPISDPTKAKNELGWKAHRSLKESIENTWRFLSQVRNRGEDRALPRVLHFLPYFPPHPGGVEMYAKEWAKNYVIQGGEVCIVTFSGGQKEKSRKVDGYEIIVLPAFDVVHSFPFPIFWLPSFWIGLYKAKKWKPQIIHTHTRFFLSSFLGGIFAKITRIPWIHIEHGSGFVVTGKKYIEKASRLYDHTLGLWTLKNAHEVISVSEACEHFVRDEFQVKHVRTIYRGMDQFSSTVTPSEDEIHIGFVGRLVDLKGIDILLQSFAEIIESYRGTKKLKLRIVGDGPERNTLEKLTKSLNLSSSVEFLGSITIDEVRHQFLPSLHIFVNPSFQEGLPTSVIEALIAGCKVVATDVGGTREILRHASFMLVTPRNVQALSHALMKTLEDIQTKNLVKIPTGLFLWEQTFREFREVYNYYL